MMTTYTALAQRRAVKIILVLVLVSFHINRNR